MSPPPDLLFYVSSLIPNMNMYVNCEWCSGIISGHPSCAICLKTSKKCANQGFVKKFGNDSAFWKIFIYHSLFEIPKHKFGGHE